MIAQTWRFAPHDSWFFRESRPHGVVGGSELGSVFPPPARTLAGATRFLMGTSVGVDWAAFGRGQDDKGPQGQSLQKWIGYRDQLGDLRFGGPWLSRHRLDGTRERLYPAPAFLMTCGEEPDGTPRPLLRLRLGPATRCDLGKVPLPEFPEGEHAKPLDDAWLTRRGLETALAGDVPKPDDIFYLGKHSKEEARLGIARDNSLRTNLDGLLYQTRHLRLAEDLAVEVDVAIDTEDVDPRLLKPPSPMRFGGEGRMATIKTLDCSADRPSPPLPGAADYLALCLVTPADFDGSWLPPGFDRKAKRENDPDVWSGQLKYQKDGRSSELPLTLHAAILGKPLREGGWDLALPGPRPVRSLLPAGSTWLCRAADGDSHSAIKTLHGASIGLDTDLGRGQLAVGIWPNHSIANNLSTQ